MRKPAVLTLALLFAAAAVLVSREPQPDPRLKHAFRRPAENGWTFVHLEGSPSEIGYQHGYLLPAEIQDAQRVISLELLQDTKRNWNFFRDAARTELWPHIETQYRQELAGIAAGLQARGAKLDVWDVVALNAFLEWNPYYIQWYEKKNKLPQMARLAVAERCSAFVATGSYTRDGRIVIAHNAWTGYMDGERWTMVFDIVPSDGHRFLMDGFPGLIHSADDFSVNSAGILITETTISRFHGWNPHGIPEFVRARKAAQYSSSIDEFARWMSEGNNGGYANTWLVADRKTNEVASLELGLKNVTLQRTKDGYFVGSNFPENEKLLAEETDFDARDMGASANARRVRWRQLMEQNKGKIDIAAGQRFLGDHYDTFTRKQDPCERTLCGHIDLSPRGSEPWQPPYGIAGAVQNKVADAALAERMSFTAAAGHACGIAFRAAPHLKAHPEFAWQKELLRDMNSRPWTTFQASHLP
ncbi:MAG TPA: C45 family peptidase [Bryobacteraceae bacterium]|nr:C45 family peptidase [Bryobacteraceae bacterium]